MPVIMCIILGALVCLLLALLAGQVRSARAGCRGGSLPRGRCLLARPGVPWGVSEWERQSWGDKSVCSLRDPIPSLTIPGPALPLSTGSERAQEPFPEAVYEEIGSSPAWQKQARFSGSGWCASLIEDTSTVLFPLAATQG